MNKDSELPIPIENVKNIEEKGSNLAGVIRSAKTLATTARDLGGDSVAIVERELSLAISISEQIRDNVIAAEALERVRSEGVLAQLRRDAHQIVDLTTDIVSLLLYGTIDYIDGIIKLQPATALDVNRSLSDQTAETDLSIVEGIGAKYTQELNRAGIHTLGDLITMGATRKGRHHLAQTTNISEKRILTWVNHVDLFRVKGIGEEYADLLEAAGVDSIPELAQRNPENLYHTLLEVNRTKKRVRRIPSLSQILDWVEQAKQLPRIVSH